MTVSAQMQLFLSRLEGVKVVGNGWVGSCPAHDDRVPSLSVNVGDEQPVVFHCMAGCSQDNVLAEMGLTWADILGASPNGQERVSRKSPPKAYQTFELAVEAAERQTQGKDTDTWSYHRANGDGHFRVVRFDSTTGKKQYRPFHRTKRGWMQTDPQGKLSLYRLPELLNADIVYGFEGEKCVEAARKLGLTATTSAHGCQAPHKSDWTPLAGKQVVWLPDADAGGRKYSQTIAGILTSLDPPATVKIVELPDLEEHGDIVDFIKDRRIDAKDNAAIRAELSALTSQAPLWTPGKAAHPEALVKVTRPDTLLAAPQPYRNVQESMTALNQMAETARKVVEVGNTLAVEVSLWLDRRGEEALFEKIEHPIPYAAAALKVSVSYLHKLGQIGRVLRCLTLRDNEVIPSKRAILPLARLLETHPENIPKALQDATELAEADARLEGRTKPRPVKSKHTAAAVDEILGPVVTHTPVKRKPSPDARAIEIDGVRRRIEELAAVTAAILGDDIPAHIRARIVALAEQGWCRQ